jgi:hypothetical protein
MLVDTTTLVDVNENLFFFFTGSLWHSIGAKTARRQRLPGRETERRGRKIDGDRDAQD